MSDGDRKIDPVSGVETTGHSWDGIEELNNPLPRWWLYIFYATVAWAVIYMIFMPALPALPGMGGGNTPGLRGHSDRANVAIAMQELRAERAVMAERLLTASLQEIESDLGLQQFALAKGESAFGDNCATCHGAGGRGVIGYPALVDDVWIWDGTLDGIEYTIRHGVREAGDPETRFSLMPAFGRDGLLTDLEIRDLTQYVLSVSGREHDSAAAARAQPLFMQQCASCHGEDARGDRSVGAPNLTDQIWIFGGSPREIQASIHNARNAHMPAWQGRLDEATIRALAVYVHTLGGGEK